MCVEMNKKNVKNIRDVIDCTLKKDDKILVIFGVNIPDATARQFPTSLSGKTRTSQQKTSIN